MKTAQRSKDQHLIATVTAVVAKVATGEIAVVAKVATGEIAVATATSGIGEAVGTVGSAKR